MDFKKNFLDEDLDTKNDFKKIQKILLKIKTKKKNKHYADLSAKIDELKEEIQDLIDLIVFNINKINNN